MANEFVVKNGLVTPNVQVSGSTSGTTTLSASAAASGTLTLPAATDTLVGKATTDTLTNKSISGSTNTLTNIPNSALTNSTISGVSLGSNLNTLTISTGLSGTSYNGSGAVTIALANTAVTAGSYGSSTSVPVITVDAQGRITAASTAAISGSLTFTGDVTGTGNTGASTALTLASVNANIGTFNNVTVNAKGLVTAASNVAYLTSYTETDTLATVTGRGASTSTALTLGGTITVNADIRVFKAGSDTINSQIYFANATNTVAYNWQTDTSNRAALFGYTSSWNRILTIDSTGLLIAPGNIGSTSSTVLNLAATGNTGTWIGAIQDGTSGWSLSGATIGFKSDNTTYAAIGIGTANGLLYFGRTTASGTGTMSSWLEVDSGGVANFKRARPQYNGSNVALSSDLSSYLPLSGGTGTGNWYTSAYVGSSVVHIRNDSLEDRVTASDNGGVAINYYGYGVGTAYSRNLNVYDGKGAGRFWVYGANNYTQATGSLRAPIFYDSDNTSYYIDPTSTSAVAGAILIGPNSSSRYTRIGGNGGQTDEATISASNGNLHVDSKAGYGLYLNHYSSGDIISNNGGGIFYNYTSVRSPIFYDYNDTTYYLDPGSYSRIRQLTLTNARVDSSKYPIGHYVRGEEVFSIDPTWTQDQLREYFGSNNVSWVADSSAPGGYAISIVGNVNVGNNSYSSGFPWIPVESDDIFYMECYVKDVSGTNSHYMGSIDFNESFSNLGGNPGSYGYWVMSGYYPGASWTKVTGYITGFGTATGQFKSGTKYWTPQALFNYSGGGTSYISGWKVTKVNQRSRKIIQATGLSGGTSTSYQLQIQNSVSASTSPDLTFGADGSYGYIQTWNSKPLLINNQGNYIGLGSDIRINSGNVQLTSSNVGRNTKWRALDSSSDVGISYYNVSDQWLAQFYANYNDGYGFLNGNWGSWDLKKVVNGVLYMNNNTSYYLRTDSDSYMYRVYGAADIRSPIFYDNNNTAYYTDPASTSVLNNLTVNGTLTGSVSSVGGVSVDRIVYGDGGVGAKSTSYSDMNSLSAPSGFFYYSNPTGSPTSEWTNWINCIGNSWSGTDRYGFQLANSFWNADLYTRRVQSGTWQSWNRIFHTGSSDVRAPIFYDVNDTSYYDDPASTSKFNVINTNTINCQNGYSFVSQGYNNNGGFAMNNASTYWGLMWNYAANDWRIGWGSTTAQNGWGMRWDASGNAWSNSSHRAPIFYDNDNTGYYIDPNGYSYVSSLRAASYLASSGNVYIDSNYGYGVVGVYTSTRYQGVFAMGDSYKLPADGTTTGSLYGIAWSHPNAGGVAANLNTHGALIMENGGFLAALSGSIRSRDDMRTPIYYDNNNTGYYANLDGTTYCYYLQSATTIRADSDARLKDNVVTLSSSLEKVMKLRGVTYTRKDLEDKTKKHIGLIAQEVLEVIPEVVGGSESSYYSVGYAEIVPVLIEAIKEQQSQIDELKALVKQLLAK